MMLGVTDTMHNHQTFCACIADGAWFSRSFIPCVNRLSVKKVEGYTTSKAA